MKEFYGKGRRYRPLIYFFLQEMCFIPNNYFLPKKCNKLAKKSSVLQVQSSIFKREVVWSYPEQLHCAAWPGQGDWGRSLVSPYSCGILQPLQLHWLQTPPNLASAITSIMHVVKKKKKSMSTFVLQFFLKLWIKQGYLIKYKWNIGMVASIV